MCFSCCRQSHWLPLLFIGAIDIFYDLKSIKQNMMENGNSDGKKLVNTNHIQWPRNTAAEGRIDNKTSSYHKVNHPVGSEMSYL